ncbi:MAG: pantetheine-phosphate adenylyltransferase [Solobacterium sp.]|nr:pantetheine-phosphate adenylyltransferase [Solobacterium sp.]
MKACYPGTFDPITNGHIDIIQRAARMYEELVVLIMANPRKKCLFSAEERKEFIERCLADLDVKNVRVEIGSGLTVQYARKLGCKSMIRGIRAVSDYEYELQTATANLALDPEVETVFLIAKPEMTFLSSSVVKEIAMNGGKISGMVPSAIAEDVFLRIRSELV